MASLYSAIISVTFIVGATMAHAAPSTAKSNVASCNWNQEVFKAKISSSCQNEFEGKLTDEQDKIYSHRMFQDWELPKDTEVFADGAYLEVVNDRLDTSFQSYWLSQSPATLWVNGTVVFDDMPTDKSISRRVKRMLQKADETALTKRDPVSTFLLGNEAYAESVDPEEKLQFLYTVNGYTGTADDIINKKNSEGALVDETSFIGRMFGSKNSFSCVDHKLAKHDMTFDGKTVTVTQTGRTKFSLKGLLSDPDKLVFVDMRSEAVSSGESAVKKVKEKVKDKKKKWHTKYVTRSVFDTPCQGRSSAQNESTCKDAWNDYFEKFPEQKDKLTDIQEKKGDKFAYGHDLNCKAVSDDVKECRKFFNERVAVHARIFGPRSAKLTSCSLSVDNEKGCRKLNESDLGKDLNPSLNSDSSETSDQSVVDVRNAYRKALKEAGEDADALCPDITPADYSALAGDASPFAVSVNREERCNHWHDDKKMSAATKKTLAAAYHRVLHPKEGDAEVVGGDRLERLSTRLLGQMMLADCCADEKSGSDGKTCKDRVGENTSFQLNDEERLKKTGLSH